MIRNLNKMNHYVRKIHIILAFNNRNQNKRQNVNKNYKKTKIKENKLNCKIN